MRLIFMGTPEFAVPSLSEIIAAGHEVACVYTQPPRRAGRGKKFTQSPVHQFAHIMGLSVQTPESFRKPSVIDALDAWNADAACVVAYGQILPARALAAPRLGCLNLHASLLPRWRGAAPIQRAIMAGDDQTGVQIMQMAKGLDTGDILLSETVPITPTDTAGRLTDTLARIGADMWPRALAALERGGLVPTPQSGEATYAHKIDKSEARMDWSRDARDLDYHIRGLAPFPGAWCEIKGLRVKIHHAQIETDMQTPQVSPGTTLDNRLLIACGSGGLRLLTIQPAGKSIMTAEDFLRGTSVPSGHALC